MVGRGVVRSVAWSRVAVDAVVPRVEELDQPFDRSTLSAGVGTLHHDQKPWADLAVGGLAAQLEPEFEKSLLRCSKLLN